jgi:hypothetical protein
MPERTVEQDNEVEKAKALSRIRDRARLFREVLTSPHGQLVLDALNAKFSHTLPPNVLDNNGRTDEYQTWRRLGHFDVLEYIHAQLEWKESNYVDTSRSSSEP